MIAKNKLKEIVEKKGISIYEIANNTGMYYSSVYNAINREYLDDTKLGSLILISKVLDVPVREMYEIEK